jgi:hypothetical protein
MSKTTIPKGGITADAIDATLIADNAISEEHIDATVITGSTALAETPADTDELLISDAGTIKRIDYSYVKGGAHVLLQTITISDQANVTFDSSLITSTYKKYVVEFISCKLASDTYLSLFASTDNGSNYGTSSAYQTVAAIFEAELSSNSLYTRNNNSANDLTLVGNAESVDANYVFNLIVEIYDPTLSGSIEKGVLFRGFYNPPDGNMAATYGSGTFRSGGGGAGTSAVNNIKFQAGTGNLASGTVKLYGVN